MSVQLPCGDLISPTSFMNNTHMKPDPAAPDPNTHSQHQPMMSDVFMQQQYQPNGYEHNGQYMAPAGPDTATIKSDPEACNQRNPASAVLGFHTGSPSSPYAAAGVSSFGSDQIQLPADSAASHGSTDLGSMIPGLPQFSESQDQQSFGRRSAAASTAAMQMQDMHPAALPAVGAGSPRAGFAATGFASVGNADSAAVDVGANSRAAAKHGGSSSMPHSHRASSSGQYAAGGRSSASIAAAAAAGDSQQVFRSQYRGVSYDKKKRKWRVQIKVAALGKSGVSVGYFDTEDAAARAYDRAAIGLLGRQNCRTILNFPIEEYDNDSVPELVGKSREEVKATLKSERAKMPRRRLTNRRRTSRYLGVGSSNRKNQWQARILYHGKVTHLGYYRTEEEAARVYDKVSISLHGAGAQTNFPIDQYKHEVGSLQQKLSGLTREELQRALGVKPMDKSSKYRGVSKKKGRWEAKVMLNRKWAYREMFDTEMEAARAYDTAVWRLKPREARNYVNFKDSCPTDVAEMLKETEKDAQLELHPTGLPLTAKPLIDAGLLYDDEGQSIRAPNGMTRSVSIGDIISLGDSATHSASEPSAGNGSGGAQAAHSSGGGSGGATGAVAGAPEGAETTMGATFAAGGPTGRMVKSASFSALSAFDAGAVTSNMSNLVASPPDPAAAAAAPVPASSLSGMSRGGLQGEMSSHHLGSLMGQQPLSSSYDGSSFFPPPQHHYGQQQHQGSFGGGGGGGMPRVHSVPQLRSMDAGSPSLPHASTNSSGGGLVGSLQSFSSSSMTQQQQQYGYQQQSGFNAHGGGMQYGGSSKLEGTFWNTELTYQGHQQQQHQQHNGMRMSRSCGNLAFMSGSSSPGLAPPPATTAAMHSSQDLMSPREGVQGNMGSPADFTQESKPLMVRVGSEQHLLNPNPSTNFKGGLSRIASESHLSNMVPVSPSGPQFLGPERGFFEAPNHLGATVHHQQQQQQPPQSHYNASSYGLPQMQQQQQQTGMGMGQMQQQQQQYPQQFGSGGFGASGGNMMQQQQQMGGFYSAAAPQGNPAGGMQGLAPMSGMNAAGAGATAAGSTQQPSLRRNSSSSMHRTHSCATLESIDETAVFRTHGLMHSQSVGAGEAEAMLHNGPAPRAHSMPGNMTGMASGPSFGVHSQQQQQQQFGNMAGNPNVYGSAGSGMGIPRAPMPGQQYDGGHFGSHQSAPGQHGVLKPPQMPAGNMFSQGLNSTGHNLLPPHAGCTMTGAAAAEAFGASAAAAAGMGYGMNTAAATGMPAVAPAAAAEVGKPWQNAAQAWSVDPGSPLGNVQIGGEDLDVAMAFLAEGSPRRLSEAGHLDIGLSDFEPGLHLHSPTHSNGASALLYDTAMAGGLDVADLSMKMDE